jgi:hypothetical protein
LIEEKSGLEKKVVELEASIKATEKDIKAMVDTHAKEKASMILHSLGVRKRYQSHGQHTRKRKGKSDFTFSEQQKKTSKP